MINKINDVIQKISPLNKAAEEEQQLHLNSLTKPIGSLGHLEKLAVQLAGITSEIKSDVFPPGIIVFASDHGICKEGVSAYPQEVTTQMVLNFLNGGAAINVFTKRINGLLEIVDVGVISEISDEQLVQRKIDAGTKNFFEEDAMTQEQAIQSIWTGMERAEHLIEKGAKLLIVGEMGIGNTSSSSAMLSVLSQTEVEHVIGFGTGLEQSQVLHKANVIKQAIENRKPDQNNPLDILSKVGGFEIGAMAGAMLYAAYKRIPVLLDGFICTTAAVLASKFNPLVKEYMIAGHLSQEPGHAIALNMLGKKSLLNMGMRLGEGSGAALAYPLVEAAVSMVREMATFEGAGVSNKK